MRDGDKGGAPAKDSQTVRTANLRRQHDAALQLATEMSGLLASAGAAPAGDAAYRLSMLIARLIGALRIHFAQEDRVLYPMLMASGRGDVAATARRFQEEMGQIGPAVADYGARWASSGAIARDWPRFRDETEALLAALGRRIARENDELYPLADAEAAGDGRPLI